MISMTNYYTHIYKMNIKWSLLSYIQKGRNEPYLSNFKGVSQPNLIVRGSSDALVKSKTTKFWSHRCLSIILDAFLGLSVYWCMILHISSWLSKPLNGWCSHE